jgi:hypothetical protein
MGRAHVSNRNSIDRGPITEHGPCTVPKVVTRELNSCFVGF